jgi:diguanylate cyclase (GGDEF)-like protein
VAPTGRTRTVSLDPQERRIRRSWWLFGSAFVALALLTLVHLAVRPELLDVLLAILLGVAGVTAVFNRRAVQALEAGRRSESESFARILQGLSRSISPDAIVEAIVEELGSGTRADHIVICRRRPDAAVLEATLVSSRPGVPSSTTLLPLVDLDDPDGSDVLSLRHGVTEVPVEHDVSSLADRGGPGPVISAPALERPFAAVVDPQSEPARRIAERLATRVREVYGLKHTLAAPLVIEAGVVGAIVLSRRTADSWPPAAERILAAAAVEASAALSRVYSHRAAETRASTDALTGMPNRRYFDEFCALLGRRRRSDDTVGVLMIDIDHFKGLNDAHGHGAGDEVLRRVAKAIGSAVREDDVPARYGGEEFAVLLRNSNTAVAMEVGERVRDAVARMDLTMLGIEPISVSVGVAVAISADQPIAELIEQADAALYRAKNAGRDRVVAA